MKKKTIDIASIIGLILAYGLVVFGMITKIDENGLQVYPENLAAFYDLSSVLIVVGGTVGCMMLMYPMEQFPRFAKHMQVMYMPNQYSSEKYIETLLECAKKARMSGLLSLEEDANQMTDAFLQNSLQMIVDSVDPESVKAQMESWIDCIDDRHASERGFYDKAATLAPGFGMIGTLIGLINLMKTLDDIASVGPNMSVALLTTMYGSMMANIMFMPVSNKLKMRNDEEILCMTIVSEGIQAIQAGENPKLIESTLLNLLPRYKQDKIMKKGGLGGGEGGD